MGSLFRPALPETKRVQREVTPVEDEPMHFSRPTFKNELNMTTVVAIFGLAVTLGGWVWSASETRSEIVAWQIKHDEMQAIKFASDTGRDQRTDQRLKALEDAQRKTEQLEYRMAVQEQGAVNLSRSVEELKTTVNGQSADIKVVLEILKRMDPTVRN